MNFNLYNYKGKGKKFMYHTLLLETRHKSKDVMPSHDICPMDTFFKVKVQGKKTDRKIKWAFGIRIVDSRKSNILF